MIGLSRKTLTPFAVVDRYPMTSSLGILGVLMF
jgi:hypothetical protein